MFIISLNYIVPNEAIDEYLDAHVQFLKAEYKAEHFVASGRKVPRIGGVIIANVKDKDEVLKIIEKDPFKINKLAEYEIIEVNLTMTCRELEFMM